MTTARDLSIDFIKGIAALFVVLLHNMPNKDILSIAYLGQAVPLFILVSAYLTYGSCRNKEKNALYFSVRSTGKMLNRVFKPFLIVTLIQYLLYYLIKGRVNWTELFTQGGFGPGCYYPWIYLQCWLILPLVVFITDRISTLKSGSFFIVICILSEVASAVCQINDNAYRLLFYRYLFLLYLGCLIAKRVIKLNKTICILSFGSLALSLLEIYTNIHFSPFWVDAWQGYHWSSYFYSIFVFLLLIRIYERIQSTSIASFFVQLGNYSYEIFLAQMFVYSMIGIKRFDFIGNVYLTHIAYILCTTTLSILPVYVYKVYLKPFMYTKRVTNKDNQ